MQDKLADLLSKDGLEGGFRDREIKQALRLRDAKNLLVNAELTERLLQIGNG